MRPDLEGALRELERVEEIERSKMQDRTRAIVEAAERLAKGLDLSVMPNGAIYRTGHAKECECDHDDDLDELLVPLGKALSLPAPQWTRTPPSEPGTYWFRGSTNQRPGKHLIQVDGPFALGMGWRHPERISVLDGEWFPVRIEEPPA